jgi:dihydroorotate dehydrogenase electron transfer subunit
MEILLDVSGRRPHSEPPADDRPTRVLANEMINAEYKLLVLQADASAAAAQAGQFFNLECPAHGDDKPFLRRPMSVYEADPGRERVSFLYKVTGAGTRGLAALRPGDVIWTLGPLGQGFHLDPNWRAIVLIGRGVGLATLAPLADLAAARGIAATVVLSARGPEQLMAVKRFTGAGAEVVVALDSDGSSAPEAIEDRLRLLHREGLADAFFVCGSNRLMLLIQRLGQELGVSGQVAIEQQMACGLGMCFCCVRNFQSEQGVTSRRVCWDGPVFDLAETLSW